MATKSLPMCLFFLFAFGSFSWVGIKVATWKVTLREKIYKSFKLRINSNAFMYKFIKRKMENFRNSSIDLTVSNSEC